MTKKPTKEKNDQWVVRGVSQEAKNAAKLASKKTNEFLGVWLSRKVIEAAQKDLGTKNEVARQEDLYNIIGNLHNAVTEEIQRINTKLDHLSEKRSLISRWLKK